MLDQQARLFTPVVLYRSTKVPPEVFTKPVVLLPSAWLPKAVFLISLSLAHVLIVVARVLFTSAFVLPTVLPKLSLVSLCSSPTLSDVALRVSTKPAMMTVLFTTLLIGALLIRRTR